MRLTYLLACEGVSIDQFSNNISLFNVFERCIPGTLPRVVVVSTWSREPGDENRDFQASLRVRAGDNVLGDFPQNFRMTAPSHRVLHNLLGLPVQLGQQIVLEMRLNDELRGSYQITVEHPPASGAVAQSE